MAKVRKKRIQKADVLLSDILLENEAEQKQSNTYLLKYGIEHLFRCGRSAQARELLFDLSFFARLLDEWNSFVAPLRFWRVLGLQNAKQGYLQILEELGRPQEHKSKERTWVRTAASFFRKAGLYRLAISYMEWGMEVQGGGHQGKNE